MEDVNKVANESERICSEDNYNMFDDIGKQDIFSDSGKKKEYFTSFDKDGDGYLNAAEFSQLLCCLFCCNGKPYCLSEKQEHDLMKLLDENQDDKIDEEEFTVCWEHWLKQILSPVSALIIVDVQNDFISGTLSVKDCPARQNGDTVVPIINHLLQSVDFDLIVYSCDWHPPNHISFIENVDQRKIHHTSTVTAVTARKFDLVTFAGPPIMEQKLWPAHCVQNTWGAELHKDLKIVNDGLYVYKGTNPEIDSYSAFWDNKKLSQTPLVSELTKKGITDVYVCGLAYDVCVGSTALHSLEHGFRTVLVEDACRGVSLHDIDNMRQKLIRRGAAIIDSSAVADMVSAVDRRPELGYQAAVNVAMARKLVKESECDLPDTAETEVN